MGPDGDQKVKRQGRLNNPTFTWGGGEERIWKIRARTKKKKGWVLKKNKEREDTKSARTEKRKIPGKERNLSEKQWRKEGNTGNGVGGGG